MNRMRFGRMVYCQAVWKCFYICFFIYIFMCLFSPYATWLGFCCWNMLISAFLPEEAGGGCFSPPIPQAVQLSSLMQKGSTSFALGMRFKSNATFLCSSISRFVEGIANIPEQALDNFGFFSISYGLNAVPIMKLSCFMFFIIKIDTVLRWSPSEITCNGCEGS